LKNRTAFTMIEVVFVIVVLGILASLAMGRMDRDLRQEAAETILSHIRLTQQLALRDNKHRSDNDARWQRAYWRFEYGKCSGKDEYYYRVGSDVNILGSINKSESAINPMDGKYLYTVNTCNNLQPNESPVILLGKKFGVKDIKKYGGCSNVQHIAFDYLGRPHHQISSYSSADFSHIMTSDCNMTFTMSTDSDNDGVDDTFSIIVKAETGHAYIEGQEDL